MTHDFRSLADKVCAQIRSEQNCWIGDFLKFSESIESALKQVYESRPKCEIVREIYSVGNKVSNVFFQSKEDATNYLKEYGTGSNGLYISTIPVIANTKIKEKE